MPGKRELRKQLHDIRDDLTDRQVETYSKAIHRKINSLEVFQRAQTVHMYLPIANRNEVDTMPIARQLLGEKRTVVVPVTLFNEHSLKHVYLKQLDNLITNKWNVPEPPEPHHDSVSLEELDLVLVPMLGGDDQGNRIGYGKGYYDRFLKKVDCPKMGLIFDCCLVEKIPTEHHDVVLDYVVTERRIIKSKRDSDEVKRG